MAYSYVLLPGDGSNTDFVFNFGYLAKSHIHVSVDSVDTPFTWLGDFTIQISPAPTGGATIEIRRRTPQNEPIVDWTDGTVLSEQDMDLNSLFSLYTAQEATDGVDASIRQDSLGRWDGLGREAINFADPTSASGLVTKGYFDNVYTPQLDQKIAAANSDIDAKVSVATTQASNATTSATNSANSATASAGSATSAENTLKAFKGQYYGELSADPTTDPNGDPVSIGDLYFNTTANEMRVFGTNSQWRPAGSTIEGILKRPPGNTPIIATAGQTVVPVVGGYDPFNILVRVNGIGVTDPDVDTSSGTQVVFAVPLGAGDEVDYYAFGSFQVAELRADVIPVAPISGISSTDVQGALEDIYTAITVLPLGFTMSWPGHRSSIPAGYIPRDGQEVSQSLYPQHYAQVVAGEFPVTDEATWQANPAMRGCYVLESSPGNFRMPDWNGKSGGAIDRVFVSGDGGSAAAAGVIQEDAIQNITGGFGQDSSATGMFKPEETTGAFTADGPDQPNYLQSTPSSGWKRHVSFSAADSPGTRTASRNRPVNIAGIWITKVADVATNPGTVDIVALAAQASATDAGLQTLDGELDFTIIYPNGGTAASPANVAINSRYVEDNPFPGHHLAFRAEVYSAAIGAWVSHPFWYSTGSYGIAVTDYLDDIVITTGSLATYYVNIAGGGPVTVPGSNITTAPCRVLVWKLKGATA